MTFDTAPDTFGLPEYRVTEVIDERVGSEIRLLCGAKRFGQVQWAFVCVMKAEDLMLLARRCQQIAEEAINEHAMTSHSAGHC